MAKIIFDFDGVLVRSRKRNKSFLWQEYIERDLGISPEIMAKIFDQPRWNDIISGRLEFKKQLEETFQKAQVKVKVNDFIDYWLSNDLNWYPETLAFADEMSQGGHQVCIATNQDKIRTNYILEQEKISQRFERLISSCDLGVCKPSPEFYLRLIDELDARRAEQIIIVDDGQKNIETATKVGLEAIHFDPDIEDAHNITFLKQQVSLVIR